MVCVYCCDSYEEPSMFRAHMQVEHGNFSVETAFGHLEHKNKECLKMDCTDLICRICLDTFESVDDVAEHLNESHDKGLNLKVGLGIQIFKLGQERWICSTCDVKFPTLSSLSRHTNSHYHRYSCETCGKSYTNKQNLNQHVVNNHNDNSKNCIRCKMSFPDLESRRKHVLATENCWPLSCNLCGLRFVSKKSRRDHLTKDHGEQPKQYTCPDCGKVYSNFELYRSHFIKTHTERNLECSYCGLKFEYKKKYTEHLALHTDVKTFQCTVCPKTFHRKQYLIQHSWIHNEHKRFECRLCDRKFNQRVSWKTHMKSYHPEIVDF